MTAFKLLVRPDGRAILATEEKLPAEVVARLTGAVREWTDGNAILVFADCEVVQITDVEIDLDLAEPVAS